LTSGKEGLTTGFTSGNCIVVIGFAYGYVGFISIGFTRGSTFSLSFFFSASSITEKSYSPRIADL
jgi:hypothetical protein